MKTFPVPQKLRPGLMVGLLGGALWCASPGFTQPPRPPRSPKPAAPPISPEEIEKVLGGQTELTLHLKDATLQTLLSELSKQAGVPIRGGYWDDEQRKKPLTLDLDKVPFWEAMRQISTTLKLYPQQWGMQTGLVLYPGDSSALRGMRVPMSQLVTFMGKSITRTHNVQLGTDPDTPATVTTVVAAGAANAKKRSLVQASLSMDCVILVDPKLKLISQTGHAKLIEAVDDKGVSIAGDNTDIWLYGESPLMWRMQIPFTYRASIGQKVARLRGNVRFYAATRFDTWEIPDVSKAKGQTKVIKTARGEETYTIQEFNKNGDNNYNVKIGITRPVEIARDPDENNGEVQQLLMAKRDLSRWTRLLDAQGHAYTSNGGGGGEETTELNFADYQQFPTDEKVGAPVKLVIDLPVEIRQLEVPFEMKDLPLP